jgi:hypothetical protein
VSKIDKPFLDPQKRVDLAVADLARRVKYAGLVQVVSADQFQGTTDGSGNPTIWYETEGVTVARDYEWRSRTKPVEYDDIFRTKLPIRVNKHMTQGVRTTPEQEFFDEISYARDVLPPATTALANRLNSKIETAVLDAVAGTDLKVTNLSLDATDDPNGASALRQVLALKAAVDASGMPAQGRRLVAGANAFIWLAASEATLKYDLAQATTLYRRGVYGTIAGMEIVDGSTLLGANEFLVLHPSWAVMPTHRGQMPESGVTWARASQVDGFDIRIQRGYSMDFDRNGQVIHTYWNIEQIKDEIQRHTRQTAASANDGSEAGDPVITDDALVTTGKNVRIAKGTWTNPTA